MWWLNANPPDGANLTRDEPATQWNREADIDWAGQLVPQTVELDPVGDAGCRQTVHEFQPPRSSAPLSRRRSPAESATKLRLHRASQPVFRVHSTRTSERGDELGQLRAESVALKQALHNCRVDAHTLRRQLEQRESTWAAEVRSLRRSEMVAVARVEQRLAEYEQYASELSRQLSAQRSRHASDAKHLQAERQADRDALSALQQQQAEAVETHRKQLAEAQATVKAAVEAAVEAERQRAAELAAQLAAETRAHADRAAAAESARGQLESQLATERQQQAEAAETHRKQLAELQAAQEAAVEAAVDAERQRAAELAARLAAEARAHADRAAAAESARGQLESQLATERQQQAEAAETHRKQLAELQAAKEAAVEAAVEAERQRAAELAAQLAAETRAHADRAAAAESARGQLESQLATERQQRAEAAETHRKRLAELQAAQEAEAESGRRRATELAAQLESQNVAHAEQLTKAACERRRLETELAQLRQQHVAVVKNLEESVAQNRSEVAASRRRADELAIELGQRLSAHAREICSVSDREQGAAATLQRLERWGAELQAKLRASEQQVRDLAVQMAVQHSAHVAQVSACREREQTLQARLDDVQSALTSERKAFVSQRGELQANLAASRVREDELLAQLTGQQETHAVQLADSRAREAAAVAELEQVRVAFTEQRAELDDRHQQLHRAWQTSESQAIALANELDALRAQQHREVAAWQCSHQRELAGLETQLAIMRAAKIGSAVAVQEVLRNAADAGRQAERTQHELQARVQALQCQLVAASHSAAQAECRYQTVVGLWNAGRETIASGQRLQGLLKSALLEREAEFQRLLQQAHRARRASQVRQRAIGTRAEKLRMELASVRKQLTDERRLATGQLESLSRQVEKTLAERQQLQAESVQQADTIACQSETIRRQTLAQQQLRRKCDGLVLRVAQTNQELKRCTQQLEQEVHAQALTRGVWEKKFTRLATAVAGEQARRQAAAKQLQQRLDEHGQTAVRLRQQVWLRAQVAREANWAAQAIARLVTTGQHPAVDSTDRAVDSEATQQARWQRQAEAWRATIERLESQGQMLEARLQREAAGRRKAESALQRVAETAEADSIVNIVIREVEAEKQMQRLMQELEATRKQGQSHRRRAQAELHRHEAEIARLRERLSRATGIKDVA